MIKGAGEGKLERVVVNIDTAGEYRASETLADLRNAAETLYFPMRLVGFWDSRANVHLCPDEERKKLCTHLKADDSSSRLAYEFQLQRDRGGSLEVTFPHAQITIYLG